jgi:hypothetical protein
MEQQLIGDDPTYEEIRTCIEDCEYCHRVCLHMAMTYCLEQGGRHVEPTHFRLMTNCAEVCRTTADAMLSGFEMHAQLCAACAEVCRACAQSCERIGEDMRECVDACIRCAESCEQMFDFEGEQDESKSYSSSEAGRSRNEGAGRGVPRE